MKSPQKRTLITCRDLSANPADWILKKENTLGFGVWAKADSEKDSDRQRLSRKESQARLRQRQKEAERLERKRVAALLNPNERHREIEKLTLQLSLTETDRQLLLAKGLSDRQIEQGGYRSLTTKWQKLSQTVSDRLPGVRRNGRGINNPTPGILCPITGINGQYLSLRQYNPRCEEYDVGKYVYLSSKGRGLGVRDENGELPIAVRLPDRLSGLTRIGLSEGLEIKSLLASERLGIPVIATGGHNLAGSPIALQKAIAIAQELIDKSAIITIYGDAGAVLNRAVRHDYLKAAKLLAEWGLQVEFAWWNQVEKSAGDIDEIDLATTAIAYISADEFEQIISDNNLSEPDTEDYPNVEPDPEEYAKYLAQSQSQEQIEQEQECENIWQQLKAQLRGVNKRVKKGFGRRLLRKENKTSKKLVYDSLRGLPDYSDYLAMVRPKLIFEDGDRFKLLAELSAPGWKKHSKYILDKSFMGLGKSHNMGNYENETGKLYYFDVNHRNPSVSTVENNFEDLPVRHGGLTDDPLRVTPSGKAHQIWSKQGETPDHLSVCHLAHEFISLNKKGYNADDFKNMNEEQDESKLNPICASCSFSGACAVSVGNGYGFRYLKRQAMKNQKIRASINSLSPPSENQTYREDIAVVEEASQQLKSTVSISANFQDLAMKAMETYEFPGLHNALAPAYKILKHYLRNNSKLPYHGIEHTELIKLLGTPPDDLQEILEVLAEENPKIDEIIVESLKYSGWGKDWKASQSTANWYARVESKKETAENIDSLASNFLINLLMVWGGLIPGAMRITPNRNLIITVKCSRQAKILANMKRVILLDATGKKEYLAKKLDITPEQIIEIEQRLPSLENLTVVKVEMPGLGSSNISQHCLGKVDTLIKSLEVQHPGLPVIGLKKLQDGIATDGYWFRDNRGTNLFKGERALAAFASPRINLGKAQDTYRTLNGNLDGFENYYQDLINCEITQLIGRPRSHLELNKQFVIYLIGDHDLSHLDEYGVKVVHCHAADIDMNAATQSQQSKYKVLEAISALCASNVKVTRKSLAKETGLSEAYIKKLISKLGGMIAFRKWLLHLVESFSSSDNQESLVDCLLRQDEIITWMDLYPAPAVKESLKALESLGWHDFQLYLESFNTRIQAKIWASLLSVILDKSEILELKAEIFPP